MPTQGEGGRVGAERHCRVGNAIAGALATELRIDEVSCVAPRPAGIGAVEDLVDGLRRQVVAQPVASHIRGPGASGRRIDPDADGVPKTSHVDPARAAFGRHEVDRCAPRIALDTDVAGRPGREEQLAVG